MKLKDAVELCLNYESTEVYVENMSYPIKEEPTYKVKTKQNNEIGRVCRYCEIFHKRGTDNCPAYVKTCSASQNKNHFSSVCRIKASVKQFEDEKHDQSSIYEDVMQLKETSRPQYKKQLFVKNQLNEKLLKCQLDSGVTCNIMSISDLKRFLDSDSPILNQSVVTLTFYVGTSQQSIRSIVLKDRSKKSFYNLKFDIMESENNLLIGASDSLRLGLISTDVRSFKH